MAPQNLSREMQRLGRVPQMGPLPGGAKSAPDTGRRQLFDEFLEELTLDFGFSYLPTVGTVIPSGRCGWYGLARFSIDSIGSDVIWCGHSITLGSGGVQGYALYGGAGGDYASISGEFDGRGICLVIGPNLPIVSGAWTDGPSILPADTAVGSASSGARTHGMQQARRFMFAPDVGESGTSHARMSYRERTLPAGVFIPRGQSLDVAVVVNRTAISGLTLSRGVATECCIGELTVIRQAAKTART